MNNSLYILIGTIAEFIKLLPVMIELDKRGLNYEIVSTGQNKIGDIDLLDEIKLKKIKYTLNTVPQRKTAFSLLIWWVKTFLFGLVKLKKIATKNKVLIVHGDTISTLMGALLGKILGFKIIHIESGLRSFSYLAPFPEEINRVLVSKLSDVHFAPNSWAINNLKNVRGLKKDTENNTSIESLLLALNKKEGAIYKLPKEYFIFVLHRQENLMDKKFVKDIINNVIAKSNKTKCVFILHGNTEHALKKQSLYKSLTNNKNIILLERVPYFGFMKILRNAKFLITDGGSNQEEAFYLGLPTFIIREYTERIEGIGKNVVLGGKNMQALNEFFKNYKKFKKRPISSVNAPSKIIVDYLASSQ
jgi:UDP-N-acetylglucosamine 2-epimerase (non-hydrolysing)